MRNLILALAAVSLVGAPAYAAPKKSANTTAPAMSNTTTAPPAKPSLMSKLGMKPKPSAPAMTNTVAMVPAKPSTAAPPAPAAKPSLMSMMGMKPKPAPTAPPSAPMMAARPAAPAPMAAKGGGLKACADQWDKFTPDQKASYNAQAKGQTGKGGKALSGYNVFSRQCLKK